MLRELVRPLAMNLMATGRPLAETERLAVVITIWVILLWTMAGYTIIIDGVPEEGRGDDAVFLSQPGPAAPCISTGMFPAGAAGRSWTMLHR